MEDYITRLTKCGFPNDVAINICNAYVKEKDWKGMRLYVEAVESEVKKREDYDL